MLIIDLPEQADERTGVADVGCQLLLVHVGLRPLPLPFVQHDPIVATMKAAKVPAWGRPARFGLLAEREDRGLVKVSSRLGLASEVV